MAYNTRVIADSISEAGVRLTTLEVTFPRLVLAEFNTHRAFSRNSASSRAIPVAKQLERIKDDPFIPIYWGANQSGMQADGELEGVDRDRAEYEWLKARDLAVQQAEALLNLGLHKQITNRLLEPFMWQTVLVTATEWSNFFALRANPQAQPEIRRIAELMREVMDASTPQRVDYNGWHLPLLQEDELEWARENIHDAIKVSVGRCARVSYLTHDGQRDRSKDIELYDRLEQSGHLSPMEHVARPFEFSTDGYVYNEETSQTARVPIVSPWAGNFYGWKQHRKSIRGEHDYSLVASE